MDGFIEFTDKGKKIPVSLNLVLNDIKVFCLWRILNLIYQLEIKIKTSRKVFHFSKSSF